MVKAIELIRKHGLIPLLGESLENYYNDGISSMQLDLEMEHLELNQKYINISRENIRKLHTNTTSLLSGFGSRLSEKDTNIYNTEIILEDCDNNFLDAMMNSTRGDAAELEDKMMGYHHGSNEFSFIDPKAPTTLNSTDRAGKLIGSDTPAFYSLDKTLSAIFYSTIGWPTFSEELFFLGDSSDLVDFYFAIGASYCPNYSINRAKFTEETRKEIGNGYGVMGGMMPEVGTSSGFIYMKKEDGPAVRTVFSTSHPVKFPDLGGKKNNYNYDLGNQVDYWGWGSNGSTWGNTGYTKDIEPVTDAGISAIGNWLRESQNKDRNGWWDGALNYKAPDLSSPATGIPTTAIINETDIPNNLASNGALSGINSDNKREAVIKGSGLALPVNKESYVGSSPSDEDVMTAFIRSIGNIDPNKIITDKNKGVFPMFTPFTKKGEKMITGNNNAIPALGMFSWLGSREIPYSQYYKNKNWKNANPTGQFCYRRAVNIPEIYQLVLQFVSLRNKNITTAAVGNNSYGIPVHKEIIDPDSDGYIGEKMVTVPNFHGWAFIGNCFGSFTGDEEYLVSTKSWNKVFGMKWLNRIKDHAVEEFDRVYLKPLAKMYHKHPGYKNSGINVTRVYENTKNMVEKIFDEIGKVINDSIPHVPNHYFRIPNLRQNISAGPFYDNNLWVKEAFEKDIHQHLLDVSQSFGEKMPSGNNGYGNNGYGNDRYDNGNKMKSNSGTSHSSSVIKGGLIISPIASDNPSFKRALGSKGAGYERAAIVYDLMTRMFRHGLEKIFQDSNRQLNIYADELQHIHEETVTRRKRVIEELLNTNIKVLAASSNKKEYMNLFKEKVDSIQEADEKIKLALNKISQQENLITEQKLTVGQDIEAKLKRQQRIIKMVQYQRELLQHRLHILITLGKDHKLINRDEYVKMMKVDDKLRQVLNQISKMSGAKSKSKNKTLDKFSEAYGKKTPLWIIVYDEGLIAKVTGKVYLYDVIGNQKFNWKDKKHVAGKIMVCQSNAELLDIDYWKAMPMEYVNKLVRKSRDETVETLIKHFGTYFTIRAEYNAEIKKFASEKIEKDLCESALMGCELVTSANDIKHTLRV